MKASWITVLLFIFSFHFSEGQTIRELFLVLPTQYTPDLTPGAKDSLLRFNTYSFPGGDSIESKLCRYTSPTEDHLIIEYAFTSGQNDFTIIQLRKILKTDGKPCLIYARYGGAGRSFTQQGLRVFTYANNVLTDDKSFSLPEIIHANEFFKPGTPDSTRSIHASTISTSYDLKPSGFDAIEYLAYPQLAADYDLLETEVIRFTWDGRTFKRTIGER